MLHLGYRSEQGEETLAGAAVLLEGPAIILSSVEPQGQRTFARFDRGGVYAERHFTAQGALPEQPLIEVGCSTGLSLLADGALSSSLARSVVLGAEADGLFLETLAGQPVAYWRGGDWLRPDGERLARRVSLVPGKEGVFDWLSLAIARTPRLRLSGLAERI